MRCQIITNKTLKTNSQNDSEWKHDLKIIFSIVVKTDFLVLLLQGLLCQATLPALYAVAIVAYRTERQRVDNSGEMGHLTAMVPI